MKKKPSSPPSLFIRFFRWYCHPRLQDYIEGDLLEVYERRILKNGKRRADIAFLLDVLLLCRPGIIKSSEGPKNLTNSDMIKSYFKIGWRNLLRNKSYASINVAGLALSMTCAILIFSLVMHHLNFDNFHAQSHRLYRIVTEQHRDVVSYRNSVPAPLGENFRNDFTLAEKVARIYTESDVLLTVHKKDQVAKFRESNGLAFVEVDFFEMFNFPLAQGNSRKILTESNTAVVTERIALKYFGSIDPIGQIIWLENKIPFTVTGVLKDFHDNTDFKAEIFVSYASLKAHNKWLAHETDGWGGIQDGMHCYVLLKEGVSPVQAEEALQSFVKKFRPDSKNVHHYKLQPLADIHFNGQYGGTMEYQKLWTLSIIGAFLLFTACLNFINLATAQALRRSKEVGVRKVMGSVKYQLFWQFISETAIITSMGVVVSFALASLIAPFVNNHFGIQLPTPSITQPETILFCAGLGVAITLLAGYYPALILSGLQPVAALKGKLSHQRIGGFNTRRSLIVVQFVISQVLVIGMMIIMNQMRFTQQADLGFSKDAIVMIQLGNDTTGLKSDYLKNEMLLVPGVESVTQCFTAPASFDDWGNTIKFDNSDEEVNFRTSIKLADADYLPTFDLQLAVGRNLTPSDTVREILVNEMLVRKLGLDSPEEALGKIIRANGGEIVAPIVGVLKDFHDKSFHEDISPILMTTLSDGYSNYAVKINHTNMTSAMEAIEKIWLSHHSDQLFEYTFLDDQIAQFYETEKVVLKSIQVFSFIAIFIGCLGLYGLISFMAAQKTKEVGIRKVLGASATHILAIFGEEFVRLTIIASLIAIPIGWWLMDGWLQEFKFQVGITPLPFLLAIGSILLITFFTISYQVFKSAMTNPVNSLKSE